MLPRSGHSSIKTKNLQLTILGKIVVHAKQSVCAMADNVAMGKKVHEILMHKFHSFVCETT